MERHAEIFILSLVALAAIVISTFWVMCLHLSYITPGEASFWTILQVIVTALFLYGYGFPRRRPPRQIFKVDTRWHPVLSPDTAVTA